MDPATIAALVSALSTIAGSTFGGQGPSTQQKRHDKVTNELLQGLRGEGEFADLFADDYDAFQKSFVEPAQQRFKDVTAPNIQQSFIASGQQRGTGLDDSLTRAGVDMDTLLNQQYADFQERGKNRRFQGVGQVLNQGLQGQSQPQGGFGQAATGFASSTQGQDLLVKILNALQSSQGSQGGNIPPSGGGSITSGGGR
jgi:hypothetical protein